MDADLDTLCTVVYCTADDLLPRAAANARREVTDAEVVSLCVAQAVMGILKRPPVPEGRPQAARAPVWQAARPTRLPQAPAPHGGHRRVADGGLRRPEPGVHRRSAVDRLDPDRVCTSPRDHQALAAGRCRRLRLLPLAFPVLLGI
jgi:hypothetical protein